MSRHSRSQRVRTPAGGAGAVLLGVAFSRYVVRSVALATMSSETVTRHLADLIRPIVRPRSSSPTVER
ncbi:hypothetical protein [Streptomyces sp. NPDC047070]|uniref:TetR/AcrR family transcriptional regulator n=1 Tax=Streptomyces sp. NPDC047070 TaxID=3154923 RepID=UPI00345638D0